MNIALAGTTGYLGKHIAQELNRRGIKPTILTRRWDSEFSSIIKSDNIYNIDFSHPITLRSKLLGTDIVISSLGITRQKDNLTYMDVDYKANSNLLEESRRSGVKKFIYISALNGDTLRDIKIFEAKEKFVDELKHSGLEYIVIRPNGFFSDMKDFLNMAQSGRVYLFGQGQQKLNPISGFDLANFIVDSINRSKNEELEVGGPKVYTHKQIAELAFQILEKKVKITYIPDFFRRLILKVLPMISNTKTYGPIEFFLSAMGIDMVAPQFGEYTLEDFYKQETI